MSLIDFTGVSSGFEVIPEGQYPVAVFKIEQKDGQSGFPYLNWTLKIQEGDQANRNLFFMTSLKPEALWKLKESLLALGYDKEELKGNFDFDPQALCGTECIAEVIHEEYKGETRDRVAKLISNGSNSGAAGVGLYR